MPLYQDYKSFFEREYELGYHDTYAVREQIDKLIAAIEGQKDVIGNLHIKIDMQKAELEAAETDRDVAQSEYESRTGYMSGILKSLNSLAKEHTKVRMQLAEAQAKLAEVVHEKLCTEHLMTSPNDRWDELGEWLDRTGYINQSFLLRCDEERSALRAQITDLYLTKDREIDNLRAQLAEAEAVTKGHKVCKDCDILRQELADARAETERLRVENKAIEEHIAEHGV